ncbi:manganese efflux pump MntP family protein [Sporolactobacillus kofuensis]|uniref:Putative manganese efflux pump MntP n=1 Tax=Sporolactobacillus kofuensis TaxID=269672 RepID=A0ABW1WFP2_9BACL|nr:manganese efflux pump MntP family protein [Sporolactobacillus kofuensis]MCO7176311.1 manganese efflux pump MntP family protein [Sporolactobacillus kofuensis]
MAIHLINQGLALCVMAIALGMDAFSVCVGMGMTTVRLRKAALTGLWIGLFHIFMPLFGMALGNLLSGRFGEIAEMAGGLLMLLIGFQMILSIAKRDLRRSEFAYASDVSLLLFAASVSIDSFSVGLSMGLFGARMLAAVLMFGFTSMVMAWFGFFIGRKTGRYFGRYGEVLGGVILFILGLKLLLHFPI